MSIAGQKQLLIISAIWAKLQSHAFIHPVRNPKSKSPQALYCRPDCIIVTFLIQRCTKWQPRKAI